MGGEGRQTTYQDLHHRPTRPLHIARQGRLRQAADREREGEHPANFEGTEMQGIKLIEGDSYKVIAALVAGGVKEFRE